MVALFGREQGAKLRAAAVEPAADGADWDVERGGDLLVRFALHVGEHDHLAIPFVELSEGRLDAGPEFGLLQPGADGVAVLRPQRRLPYSLGS